MAQAGSSVSSSTPFMEEIHYIVLPSLYPVLEDIAHSFYPINPYGRAFEIQASRDRSDVLPDLRDYLATLPRSQRRLVEDATQVATDLQVWRAFRSREHLYIASDGGLSGNEGTFGWIISTRKFPLFQCGGPVDGPFDTNSSTRSELAGFVSSLLFITGLARYWGLKHRSRFKWITDSKAALSKVRLVTRRGWRATRQPNEADLLSIIASLLQELRCKVAYAWIKGHQDRLNSYDSLPFLVRLNVSADFLATRYRLRGKLKSSQRVDHDPSQKISISIHGCRLTSQYDDCLRFHINGYHLRQYIQEKRKWSDKVWDDVDFDIFGTHFRRLRPSQRTQHMKLVHDQLPLGWRRRQQSATNDQHLETCPCCLSDKETTEHFLRCHCNDQLFEGRSQLSKDSYETSPHLLKHLLMDGIRFWQHTGNQDFYPTTLQQYPQHMREAVHQVLQKQSAIGWDNALRGYLSKAWIHLASLDKDDASNKQTDSRLARQ
ncbi:hypothetical protein MHU86_4355 [Fragilaria crotonensis]|nr:hypothetical protein MHU86_4355 [Fragilaria crotonensis]